MQMKTVVLTYFHVFAPLQSARPFGSLAVRIIDQSQSRIFSAAVFDNTYFTFFSDLKNVFLRTFYN